MLVPRNKTQPTSGLFRFFIGLAALVIFIQPSSEVLAQITYSGTAKFWIHADSTDPMGLRPADWNGYSTLNSDISWSITLADEPFSGDPDPTTFIRGSITVYDKVLDIVEMGGVARPIIINDNVGISPYVDIVKFTFYYEYNGVRCLGQLRYDVAASTFTLERPTATTKLLPTFGWTKFKNYEYGPRSCGYQIRNYGWIYAEETTNQIPIADAGPDQSVECAGDFTEVNLDGSGSSDPDGDPLVYEWSVPAGSSAVLDDPTSATPTGLFPDGPTLVTLTVDDQKGGFAVSDILITVVDTTAPVVVCTTDKMALWPPKHQMEDVIICIAASDICVDPANLTIVCEISSDELDDATGDGSTTGDVDGFDGFISPVPVDLVYDEGSACFIGLVALRAERNGAENGRSYSIAAKVTDEAGNQATASCVVVVPRDRRSK